MKWTISAVASLSLLLAGCQGGESPATETAHPASVKKVTPVGEPSTKAPTKVGLVIKKGPPITVGYALPDKAFDLFRKSSSFGLEFDDAPARFEYPYRVRIWETAHNGFGEIIYDGDLVGAMYQESKVKQERVDEVVAAHREQMGGQRPDQLITGKRVTYWFWENEKQRLMICAYQKNTRGIELTVAMGDDVVMDALGMSGDLARADAEKMDAPSIKLVNPQSTVSN